MVKEVKKSKILDLQRILDNAPETIEVPDMGDIVVRYPSTKDKLDAKRIALDLTKGMTDEDALIEQARILAIKMIVEPQISVKEYLDSRDIPISIVLDTVHMWYNTKVKEMNSKRQKQVRDFLAQMKEP